MPFSAKEEGHGQSIFHQLRQLQLQTQAHAQIVQLKNNEMAVGTRLAQIEAEKVNLARQQNSEASKSLLLRSREEQLQAVLLTRFQQKRGGKKFTADEFQFLDQNTLQNITKFNPSAAPAELNLPMDALRKEEDLLIANFRSLQALTAPLDPRSGAMAFFVAPHELEKTQRVADGMNLAFFLAVNRFHRDGCYF